MNRCGYLFIYVLYSYICYIKLCIYNFIYGHRNLNFVYIYTKFEFCLNSIHHELFFWFFSSTKNIKIILSSQVIQKQAHGPLPQFADACSIPSISRFRWLRSPIVRQRDGRSVCTQHLMSNKGHGETLSDPSLKCSSHGHGKNQSSDSLSW